MWRRGSARELGAGTVPGRHLPWGSWPFDGQQSDWSCAGLPHRRPPLSGFLTLSAACSRFCLVTIFHVTAVHRLLTFRAFSARPALAPLDAGLLSCRSGSYTDLSDRVRSARLQSVHPVGQPTLAEVRRTSPSRCSPGLSPPRGLLVAPVGLAASPLVLAGEPAHLRVLDRARLGVAPESRANLHEVCHLLSHARLSARQRELRCRTAEPTSTLREQK